MADLDDDVPPLEDFSELLKQVEHLKEYRKSETKQETSNITQKTSTANVKTSEPVVNISSSETNGTVSKKQNADFGGMKKGFLFGSPTKVKKTSVDDNKLEDIPFVKPKETKEEQFQFPEVQQSLAAGQQFLQNKDWITEDLLGKVQKNEVLAKRLGDPRFMQAITEFQTNPVSAMQKYQNNKEIQSFLQSFCGLIGDHFNTLADKEDGGKGTASPKIQIQDPEHSPGADLQVRSSTNPKQPTAADEARMQEIINRPDVRDVLLDPRVQRLIETLRTDPDKAQRVLQTCDIEFKRKLQLLVEAGLLQFQMS